MDVVAAVVVLVVGPGLPGVGGPGPSTGSLLVLRAPGPKLVSLG